ncbi:winged helix-turn-helix transcriptional regulator [Pseudoclavibacter sp. VKM Ac-2888]|uniref:winged helix-turn-helix transcriptional regulator n=1 Tax=Pseudoclavibacter sp. VKM Ac-2888 TaxID=2783830 RepID=UPI00188D5045|nr:helix-turn-helix domain-containing protein [Pseudoclavibacter sp. VKM Ac-2888]MBF4550974.1 helix-turn-helix transcriptional regulator [Pseudoclavibacter sp. VKM Ac-2888]
MPRQSPALTKALNGSCAIARCLGVLDDPWSFLLIREALLGRRTFAEFRDSLGIASDVLSARLAKLVEADVMTRASYQEPGQRTREAYDLTPSGRELSAVLIAMKQWGETHVPREAPAKVDARSQGSECQVSSQLIDARGRPVDADKVSFVRR